MQGMDVRTLIENHIGDALRVRGVENPTVVLEYPAELVHGDYASNVAMMYAKQLGTNPRALAEEIVSELKRTLPDSVLQIEVAGPGFINFTLAPNVLTSMTHRSIAEADAWGHGNILAGEEIMVEYTDPNPFKEFHIGHLMSNAIGESIARLFESQGAKVIRANYQGDVGMHVACALWGLNKLGIGAEDAERHGEAYAHGATAVKENETAKAEIKVFNKAVYDGVFKHAPSTWYTMYQVGREASLKRLEGIYALLGTHFDTYYFESAVGSLGQKIVESNPSVFEVSDGARVFKGEEYGLHTRVFVNAEGLPTYEAKELGLEQQKMTDYPTLSRMIVVTANEVTEYFKVLKKAMALVYPDIAQKLTHIPHGMMKLPEGKMSSRTGKIITGASLLNELTLRVQERSEREGDDTVVAVGAIKYQILKQSIGSDIIFERERALSLEGDSGPYLQYTHARCVSVLQKSEAQGAHSQGVSLATWSPTDVERLIIRFPDIVLRAACEYAPHHVAQYLLLLASTFNSWYAHEHILDGTDTQAHKVSIVKAVQTTLKNGLHLLGIQAPDRM